MNLLQISADVGHQKTKKGRPPWLNMEGVLKTEKVAGPEAKQEAGAVN